MKTEWKFVISLAGLAVSGAVLILLIPSLIRAGEEGRVWTAVVLGALAAVFAVGALRWRPSQPRSNGG